MNRIQKTVTATLLALATAGAMYETATAAGIAAFAAAPNFGGKAPGGPSASPARSPASFAAPGANNILIRPNPKRRHVRACKINCKSPEEAKVCFFTLPDFKGKSFCSKPGTKMGQLSNRWNDRISSIKVYRARTKVCSDGNLDGRCILINGSRSHLNSLDDAISSIAIR